MSRVTLCSVGLILAATVELWAEQTPAGAAGPEVEIAAALRTRDYATAVKLVDGALPKTEPAAREHLLFERGLALLYGGRHSDAVDQFTAQLEEFPDGVWARKARFRQADAYVALKQFDAAVQIYAESVRALVGDQRKAELARVYLDFAEEYFAPKDPLVKPDYERARGFYERALELEPGEALRDELFFKRAMCEHMQSRWEPAAGHYEEYLSVFDPEYRTLAKQRRSTAPLPAAATEPGRHTVAVRLALAQCRFYMGRPVEARQVCQDLLAVLDKIDAGRERFRDTWIEATYLLAQTYGMPMPAEGESLALGVAALEALLHAYPESERAIRGAHDIGTAYARLGRADEAIAGFRALLQRDVIRPTTDETRTLAEELALDGLFRIGELYQAQKKYPDAIAAWNDYIARAPTGSHWSAAQQGIIDVEYQIGADAEAEERYDDARSAWNQFLQAHPLDARAPQILFAFGRMAYDESTKREAAGQAVTWDEPLAAWRRLVEKFPQSEQAGWAQLQIAVILEGKLKDLQGALAAYRKLNWSAAAPRAQERITELQATRLLLRTERTYRTNEPARVHVDARNIDKLTVKLYRVDMQDYFRKSHKLGGVEQLDLLLIDPERTFTVDVAGYGPYKPLAQDIEIPIDGPGVYAVNVSNEVGAAAPPAGGPIQRIEATTLVVRSDLDVLVKSSRRQVLVFAQDMLTQEPAAGVQVLVSDGSRVRFEGQTGKDGVLLVRSDQLSPGPEGGKDKDPAGATLKDLPAITVLAVRDGHVAGNALSLQGLNFSTGLAAKGYLYTDRPVYRPGEAVNIRGVLREVKDGQYVLPVQPDDPRLAWKLDVLDAKDRVLRTQALGRAEAATASTGQAPAGDAVPLSEFGTFATQFRIPADAPVGPYKLIVRRPDGPTFTGLFQVAVYELPKALLRFEFDEPVILRGSPIKGRLAASYNYGEPVAGKPVEYSMKLWNKEEVRCAGVTDKEGKVPFEFDSTLFPEEGVVSLQAQQAELSLQAAGQVFIAVRAFRATVETSRPDGVFLSEEPIELTVRTRDLKGEPVAQKMTLSALLRTYARDQWTESKIESATVQTDAKTGVGRTALRLTKGGEYVLRVEGRDRFEHLVQAETHVNISDDKDTTRLRLFSDRQHYKVGDTIELTVHSRLGSEEKQAGAQPAGQAGVQARGQTGAGREYLALVTYEGEEIIGYRTLRLAPGANPLSIPVENAHFPNFAVSVAVMEGGAAGSPVKASSTAAPAVAGAEGPSGAQHPGRLHAAAREFTVERQLNITLKPDKTTYQPRDELTLEIAVTDQQGQPVQAEVGLAMIDKALLSRFADPTPGILAFFQEGARREAALRTETSCTFWYRARTRAMVTELLAEARRVDEQRERVARMPAPPPPAGAASSKFVTRVLPLQNLSAESAADLVRQFQVKVLKKSGGPESNVVVDPAANSLIVTGTPTAVEAIEGLLDQLAGGMGDQSRVTRGAPRLGGGGSWNIAWDSTGGAGGRSLDFAFTSVRDRARLESLGYVGSRDQDLDGPCSMYPPDFAPLTVESLIPPGASQEPEPGGQRGGGGGGQQLFQANQGGRSVDLYMYSNTPDRWAKMYDADGDGAGRFDFAKSGNFSYGYQLPLAGDVPLLPQTRRVRIDETNRAGYGLSAGDAVRMQAELNRLVREAPPRSFFPEVAYWQPRIATDAGGKATVKIIVPDSSTTWKLIARGVSPETLVGSAETEVVSKYDFFVELSTPATLIEGDTFEPRATVHCLSPIEAKVDVVLKATMRNHPGADSRADEPGNEAAPTQTRTIDVKGPGTIDVAFDPLTVGTAGTQVFEVSATVKSPKDAARAESPRRDALTREVPVRAWGMPIEAHAAGVGRDLNFVEIALPAQDVAGGEAAAGEYHDVQMTVAVGPSVQRWLIEEALESGPRWLFIEHQLSASRLAPPRTHADAASSLLACIYAADYLRAQEQQAAKEGAEARKHQATDSEKDGADLRLLDERIGGLIAQLLAAQDEGGGWNWCGKQTGADPWTTAHVAWALGKARQDGYAVAGQAVEKLAAYLRKVFADADPSQNELKAIVLHGLSWIGEVDFAHVNRLHRSRETLSNAALAHLALTFVRLDRKSTAGEVLGVLDSRLHEARGGASAADNAVPAGWLSSEGSSAWMMSELEVTGLALLAQLSVDPRAASVPKMVTYLTAAARADGWRPHKARGTVVAALALYYGRGQQEAANYTLIVSVNGREVGRLRSGDSGSLRVDLAGDQLQPGKQRVDFAFQGRGEYAYAVTLRGFAGGFPKPDTSSRGVLAVFDRQVMPPPVEYHGRVVPAGFTVARRFEHFRNRAQHIAVGQVASVEVQLRRFEGSENAAGDRDYVIVKETIPAGFRLLEDTLQGGYQAWDYTDNVLTLCYGTQSGLGTLSYKMLATTPGEYRLPPTIIRSLFRPEVLRVNHSEPKLTVLPRGAKSPDEYRLTPDELYQLGRLSFDDGEFAAASEHLQALLAGSWLLDDVAYRESARMLLTGALRQNDAEGIVNYFELLKEKYPDLVIPFEQIIQVAQAYAQTGQHERAYLVYRATADASFVRDAGVGGSLQQEGRFLDSIEFLEDLWHAYPDTPQVESTYYALAQALYAQAAQPEAVRPRQPRDPAPGAAAPTDGAAGKATRGRDYVTRDDLIRQAAALLERFVALYPESPAADEAFYSLASAYLDLDDYWTAINRARESIDRFSQSKWLDRFRYIEALALFHLGEFDRARELAKVVSESTYRDEQGVERPSPNKWLALYIIGQIFHAQNQTAAAIEFYKQVRQQFSDADQAVSYFEHKYVRLPEVTIFYPDQGGYREAEEWAVERRAAGMAGQGSAGSAAGTGQPPPAQLYARPFTTVSYRNIKSVVLQVYRVDLLKLALIEKNLTQITAVNLAGIKPILEKTVPLDDGQDYIDKSARVYLDEIEAGRAGTAGESGSGAAGAYLVICRGEDLFTSGLVLVTPLALEVQEDVANQRTRVSVVDAITRRGLSRVHVKVIGTGMSQFATGESDLRGLYVAEPVAGYPTIVARDADGHFAFYRSEGALLAAAPPQVAGTAKDAGRPVGKADYLENVAKEQQQIQSENTLKLKGVMEKKQKGVEVKSSH